MDQKMNTFQKQKMAWEGFAAKKGKLNVYFMGTSLHACNLRKNISAVFSFLEKSQSLL